MCVNFQIRMQIQKWFMSTGVLVCLSVRLLLFCSFVCLVTSHVALSVRERENLPDADQYCGVVV